MRIIRFDSVGGASGDMILGALIGLGVDSNALERELHALIPDSFRLVTNVKESHAMSGIALSVEMEANDDHNHHHHNGDHDHNGHHNDSHHAPHSVSGHSHRSFADIKRMIETSSLTDRVKTDSIAIFSALAKAEGAIHSKRPEEVTFHEVGATDSIIDIVGAVIGFHWLGADGISVSPIPVGSGNVKCAHGIYPIPAPATAALLKEFSLPVSLDGEECEMLTPTGAVLLGFWNKISPEKFGDATIIKTTHAFGHHEMKTRPNLLRATLYETASVNENDDKSEILIRFEANIDDASGEILGAAVRKIFDAGALDVWLSPILMKKGRPGHLLGVLTPLTNRSQVLDEIFRQTGTFGVREDQVVRHALARRWETVETRFGSIRVKIGSRNGNDLHFSPEFDDCQKRAEESETTAAQVYREAVIAIQPSVKGTEHE